MTLRFLPATILLLLCSLALASQEVPAGQQSDFAVLRTNDQSQYKASREVIAAAQRIFSEVKFTGLLKNTVEEMLGRPREVHTNHDRQVYDYMYHNGEAGIHIQFEFDRAGHVTSMHRLPTQ